ncbi:hypothetical protein PROFUN_02187 [Planoprotostelium fungivorum]|uniref:Uncharacterized protein n=1 Tax=Planoprotostelium fungivorum TaxID=1890364 RepID=A0A2P6NZC0_9EUKA|nr:hypothetical protein PROFUN_02187 [Planoprotostelium fungivorum]
MDTNQKNQIIGHAEFVFRGHAKSDSFTRQQCSCRVTSAGITWSTSQIDHTLRKTVERIQTHKCKSLDHLRVWKNIRQCSSCFRQTADRLYAFDSFHYLAAVFRSDQAAISFFLSRLEIDVNLPIALLYPCWKGDEATVRLLLSSKRITMWRSSIIRFDPWIVTTSRRVKEILDHHVPHAKKGVCQECYLPTRCMPFSDEWGLNTPDWSILQPQQIHYPNEERVDGALHVKVEKLWDVGPLNGADCGALWEEFPRDWIA